MARTELLLRLKTVGPPAPLFVVGCSAAIQHPLQGQGCCSQKPISGGREHWRGPYGAKRELTVGAARSEEEMEEISLVCTRNTCRSQRRGWGGVGGMRVCVWW